MYKPSPWLLCTCKVTASYSTLQLRAFVMAKTAEGLGGGQRSENEAKNNGLLVDVSRNWKQFFFSKRRSCACFFLHIDHVAGVCAGVASLNKMHDSVPARASRVWLTQPSRDILRRQKKSPTSSAREHKQVYRLLVQSTLSNRLKRRKGFCSSS